MFWWRLWRVAILLLVLGISTGDGYAVVGNSCRQGLEECLTDGFNGFIQGQSGSGPRRMAPLISDLRPPTSDLRPPTSDLRPPTSFPWGLDLIGSLPDGQIGAGGVGGLVCLNDPTNGVFYPAYDGNGNLAALVKSDGTVSARYEYGPFGELIRATGPMAGKNPFRFSTKYQDPETGFLYYGYRYYNPTAGRWLSRDPIGEEGGLSLYHFTGNDPVNGVDILGLSLFPEQDGDVSSAYEVYITSISELELCQDDLQAQFLTIMARRNYLDSIYRHRDPFVQASYFLFGDNGMFTYMRATTELIGMVERAIPFTIALIPYGKTVICCLNGDVKGALISAGVDTAILITGYIVIKGAAAGYRWMKALGQGAEKGSSSAIIAAETQELMWKEAMAQAQVRVSTARIEGGGFEFLNQAAEKTGVKWLSPKEYVSEIKGELYVKAKATLRNVEQGQHGVIDKRVGNQLIQKASELEKQEALEEITELMRTEGQRLINKGGSISYKN